MTTVNTPEYFAEHRTRLLAEADSMVATRSDALVGDELAAFERIGEQLEALARQEAAVARVRAAIHGGGLERGADQMDHDQEDSGNGRGTFNVNRRTSSRNPWQALERSTTLSASDWRSVAADCIEADDTAPADGRERSTRLVERSGAIAEYVALVSDPAYNRAFMRMLQDPQLGPQMLERDEAAALFRVKTRAASLTDAAGGFAVPFALDPTLVVTNAGSMNPFRRIARTVTITSDVWNGISTAGVTASWDPEASEVSDDAPTLAQPSIPVHKAQSFIPYSIEVGMDWPGFAADMGELFSDARDRLEGLAFTLGSGTNEPTGIVTALTGTASVVSTVTADTYAVADVYALSEALPARHWANASWMMHRSIINSTRRFGSGTTDAHAFLADLGADQPPRLLGKPLYENSEMDGTLTAASNNFIAIVGDFRRYRVVDRIGLQIESVQTLFGANRRPTGQRGLHAWWRTGGDSVDDQAFRMLNA